jgi:hypothetical protein
MHADAPPPTPKAAPGSSPPPPASQEGLPHSLPRKIVRLFFAYLRLKFIDYITWMNVKMGTGSYLQ